MKTPFFIGVPATQRANIVLYWSHLVIKSNFLKAMAKFYRFTEFFVADTLHDIDKRTDNVK
ncbi:hypothetical protein BCT69_02545 [Enterovibrio norvegicus]|nr:hypothetical protein BCT69_02545 [Enterovibrio norvegicus]